MKAATLAAFLALGALIPAAARAASRPAPVPVPHTGGPLPRATLAGLDRWPIWFLFPTVRFWP